MIMKFLRGEVGEVAARGPNVMLGYWRQKELSDKALSKWLDAHWRWRVYE